MGWHNLQPALALTQFNMCKSGTYILEVGIWTWHKIVVMTMDPSRVLLIVGKNTVTIWMCFCVSRVLQSWQSILCCSRDDSIWSIRQVIIFSWKTSNTSISRKIAKELYNIGGSGNIPCATLAISLAKPVETNLFSVSMTRRDIPALYILPATSSISSFKITQQIRRYPTKVWYFFYIYNNP